MNVALVRATSTHLHDTDLRVAMASRASAKAASPDARRIADATSAGYADLRCPEGARPCA